MDGEVFFLLLFQITILELGMGDGGGIEGGYG